jgi:D-serine deaminase-like pyridoxal phosphate-dependent protein
MRLPDRLDSVPTPALVLDRPRLQRNIDDMAARARRCGVALWPHGKTHKCAEIGGLQRDAGAAGMTVATVAEAEYFAGAGCPDILLAYPPVGDWRLTRLAALAARVNVRVVLDSVAVLTALIDACSQTGARIPYLWEVDSGARRLGTAPGEPTAAALAAAPVSAACPFGGLMTFGGHAYGALTDDELDAAADDERRALSASVDALAERGLTADARSAGTTPTAHRLAPDSGITELRPGNYVFYDATQVALGLVDPDRCALRIRATVVGRPAEDRVILDAGSKAVAAERLSPRAEGFGLIAGHPELRVERLYEQHAIVRSDGPCALTVGDRVDIVPNHACAAANLHRQALVIDGDELVDIWSIGAAGPGG